MSLTIMTNEAAMGAARHLNQTETRLGASVQRLASGTRITTAADDPAGLAISELMNATIRSTGVAMRNAQDGISLVQTFEGGTNEISNMLVRIRELAMQGASDTIGDSERGLLQNEVSELKNEITRIAKTTTFAGKELLAGEDLKLEFQVGTKNNADKDRIRFNPGRTNLTADGLDVDGVNVSSKDGSQDALEIVDKAITSVNETRARIGASQNRLQTTLSSQGVFMENMSAAMSRIRDTDLSKESTNLVREQILKQAGVAVLTQANEAPRQALALLR